MGQTKRLINASLYYIYMSLLTKNEYYRVNATAFQRLNTQQKNVKYQKYLASKRDASITRTSPNNRAIVLQNPATSTRNTNKNNTNKPKMKKQPQRSTVNISECTLLFAQAQIDPFVKLTKMPCIPDNICVPSYKFSCKSEGTMTVNTVGTGFIGFNPWAMVVYDLVDDSHINKPILYTNASDASPDYFANAATIASGAIGTSNSNSPFSVTQFSFNTKSNSVLRLVAAGVEIEYTGQILNQSGAITVLQNDGLRDVQNTTTVSQLQSNPRSKTCGNSKDNRCYISYSATDPYFLGYHTLSEFNPANIDSGTSPHYTPMVIFVSGATPGITFHFKAVSYFECQLPNADATPSESDPIGYPAFLAAKSTILPSDDPEVDLKNTLIATARNVAKTVSGYGADIGTGIGMLFGQPAIGRGLGSAAGSLLSSLLGT